MSTGAWGPFMPHLDWPERKARLRSLRLGVRLLTGPRGGNVETALLRAEISGGDEALLAEAETAFERLTALDKRRVLSSYAAVS